MPDKYTRVGIGAKLPPCDVHPDRAARYDFATRRDTIGGGRWMNGCPECFYDLSHGKLGLGSGQRYILPHEIASAEAAEQAADEEAALIVARRVLGE